MGTFFYIIGYLIPAALILMIIFAISLGFYDHLHPEKRRFFIKYKNEIMKCELGFPHYMDGKMNRWTGGVNIINCEDGRSFFGVTDVERMKGMR